MTTLAMIDHALRPTEDSGWVLVERGYDPLRESSLETRFAISNGFLGVRGARATTKGERWIVPARTYVAGLFETADAAGSLPALAPAPDWLQVRISAPDGPLVLHPNEVSSHCMTLDLKRGVLLSEYCPSTSCGLIVRLRTLRLVSLSDRGLGLQLVRLECEQGEVEVTLEASLDGLNLGLMPEHLEQDLGVWRTRHSGLRLAIAIGPSLRVDGRDTPPTALDPFKWIWTWKTRPGQVVDFERHVATSRSRVEDPDPKAAIRQGLKVGRGLGAGGVIAAHAAGWANRWRCSEVEVGGDAAAENALRFALYHLNGAANPDDEHVSIGARALTGDNYFGHVFWDTEIYLLPFYSLTWPEAARALLMYRFNTLDGARAKAARLGWKGALYAWESALDGAEASPAQVIGPDRRIIDVLCGAEEQHISADVAYAVWQYWQGTRDEAFLCEAGAEILLETARFWSSRAQAGEDGRRHIRGVIGPDEYHQHIDDDAFTNVMARWNIRRALDVAALLRKRWPVRWASLSATLALSDEELDEWRAVADTIATGLDPKTGLFEQFAGYFGLEQIDLADYAGRSVPMDVVLGPERTQRSQVVKQADVVALVALLPQEFVGETGAKNFRYYEPRCGHGSSLSAALHGLVAARIGDTEMARRYFHQTAAIDLADTHVAIAGGVHIAAQGGLWMMTVFGFAGLSLLDDGITLDPRLPAGWTSLAFPLQWRGRHIKISIGPRTALEATLEAGEAMTITVGGRRRDLRPGRPLRIPAHEIGSKEPALAAA